MTCKCAACSEKFSTEKNFDQHRKGQYVDCPPHYGRYCVDPATVGLKRNQKGVWISAKPMPERVKRAVTAQPRTGRRIGPPGR